MNSWKQAALLQVYRTDDWPTHLRFEMKLASLQHRCVFFPSYRERERERERERPREVRGRGKERVGGGGEQSVRGKWGWGVGGQAEYLMIHLTIVVGAFV